MLSLLFIRSFTFLQKKSSFLFCIFLDVLFLREAWYGHNEPTFILLFVLFALQIFIGCGIIFLCYRCIKNGSFCSLLHTHRNRDVFVCCYIETVFCYKAKKTSSEQENNNYIDENMYVCHDSWKWFFITVTNQTKMLFKKKDNCSIYEKHKYMHHEFK